MKRALIGLVLAVASGAGNAADPCEGKVAATILAFDRDTRQGAGLLINHCGRPVKAELLVTANNPDGFVVARMRSNVSAGAEPISVIQVELPFVQSALRLARFDAEIAATTALAEPVARSAARPGVSPATATNVASR